MKEKSLGSNISAEMMAAYLDGNATAEESRIILHAMMSDPKCRELMHISRMVDIDLGMNKGDVEFIPMTAMAASCDDGNLCCLECEKYVMRRRNIIYDENQLLQNALQNKWLKKDGTALHNIGRHLELQGLIVERRYKSELDDIVRALENGDDVIVAVDGGELLSDSWTEHWEDIRKGEMPDHTVVVLDCDMKNRTVTIFDPNSSNRKDIYPIDRFMDAWADSKYYLVAVNHKENKMYSPKPIDLSDVQLSEELNELREAIAENAHDVWAEKRIAEGWRYGEKRNDDKKENPCIVPYSQLPDSEKEYDRQMAVNTIKLMIKLGYDLVKRDNRSS